MNESEGASDRNIIQMNGSEGASIRYIIQINGSRGGLNLGHNTD